MECRLVLYQLLDTNITNEEMSGRIKQDLKYVRFRRVPAKKGNSIFYLFFKREMDTYKALLAAKKMKNISLKRYQYRNAALPPPSHLHEFPCEELPFRPFHPKEISNTTRDALTKHFEKFTSKVCHKLFRTGMLTFPFMIYSDCSCIAYAIRYSNNV